MRWEEWRKTELLWAWSRLGTANEEEERWGGAEGGERWAGTQELVPCDWCPLQAPAAFRLLLPSTGGTWVSREGTDPISTLPQAYCVSRLAVDGPMSVT